MKTSEQMLAEISTTIAHMHHRITMYVPSTNGPGAGDTIDGMFWIAHRFWASLQERGDEFRTAVRVVRRRHECGSQGFPDAFRENNPDALEEEVARAVMSYWVEIDAELGIDISSTAAGLVLLF